MARTLLLDIMLDGRFKCQLKYKATGFPLILDGEVKECFEDSDLKEFVERERPSLKGKDYKIRFTTQKVV